MNTEKREKIKLAIMLGLIIIAFGIAISIMLKYNQEGEANMPFNLSEIIVVSSAEGRSKAENPESYKWNWLQWIWTKEGLLFREFRADPAGSLR